MPPQLTLNSSLLFANPPPLPIPKSQCQLFVFFFSFFGKELFVVMIEFQYISFFRRTIPIGNRINLFIYKKDMIPQLLSSLLIRVWITNEYITLSLKYTSFTITAEILYKFYHNKRLWFTDYTSTPPNFNQKNPPNKIPHKRHKQMQHPFLFWIRITNLHYQMLPLDRDWELGYWHITSCGSAILLEGFWQHCRSVQSPWTKIHDCPLR